jgi:cardiolipin synthase (CMP-forming)
MSSGDSVVQEAAMLVAKQFADLITLTRAVIGFCLAWLGITQGAAALPRAVTFLIAAWTSDVADGQVARRSRLQYASWIGDHDLEVDMLVACGLLVYLLAAGFISPWLAIAYMAFWTVFFLRWGLSRSQGMLCQAPVYGWFILVSMQVLPEAGRWLLVWITAALILTWPRFPDQVVPGFLSGMRRSWQARNER